MIHSRQHIIDLPVILRQKGVEKVVISPGSRNAPLINAFFQVFSQGCISIVDERSAAYVGLGIASFSGKPVVLLCTSGTAALNYAPALAEAFHLGIPLIAITADRPSEWIDQQDNQTIRQSNIYAANIKGSYILPVAIHHENEHWHIQRIINEAFNLSSSGRKGPVHINVPLREPLYDALPGAGKVHCINLAGVVSFEDPDNHYKKAWQKAEKILVIAGQQPYDPELEKLIAIIALDGRVCILGEPVSNIMVPGAIRNPDPLLADENRHPDLYPDLLIYFGGQVIANRLKKFLRKCRPEQSWFVDPASRHVDTFMHLTDVIAVSPVVFFTWLAELPNKPDAGYQLQWQRLKSDTENVYRKLTDEIQYSDLGLIKRISSGLPAEAVLFAGNSSIVRYLGFFPPSCQQIFSNRGTSGIDGCVSTAVGVALASKETVYALVGDQSLNYDSNALWNRELPGNLKIIVINNQGGGIFRLINGPDATPAFKNYLESHHPVDFGKLADAYGVKYLACSTYEDFNECFKLFLQENGPILFEIITPTEKNPTVFRNFVSHLRKLT